jgi:hypothetical protein
VDTIAEGTRTVRWGSPNANFKPNFDLGKAAPFKRNDRMLDEGLDALIVYPGNGIIANMQDKAIAAGVTVWVRETK